MTSPSVPLSFVLISQAMYPDPTAVIERAGALGIGLTHEMGEPDALTFRLADGGQIIVMMMDFPHPDAADMAVGPTAADPDTIARHAAHLIVTGLGLPADGLPADVIMGVVTAAIISSSPALAAMLGHGAIFHRADIFAAFVEAAGTEIATEIVVDVTAARESEDRMSFLTHGLERYGREEFYVTSAVNGTGALEYVMGLANWMMMDRDKVLPTGDTVGRTPDERVIVQRVPSPIDGKPPVIRLDLDVDEPQGATKKKGLFRRR